MATEPTNQPRSVAAATSAATTEYDIAVGVPYLGRADRLCDLLLSVPTEVDRVVVADNAASDARRDLFDTEHRFDLDVIDLESDAGIGACRRAVRDAIDAEYMAVVDSDMQLPTDLWKLAEILTRDEPLGAVSGILAEDGSIRSGCCDLHLDSTLRQDRVLVQSIREEKSLDWSTGHPVARFDKLANAMLVRKECADEIGWDARLKDKEHIDFFVNHWENSDWEFGACPDVIIRHNRGGPEWYTEQYRHGNDERQALYRREFLTKYGYDDVVWGDTRWFGTTRRPLPERVYKAVESDLPTAITQPIKSVMNRVV